jgi:hypothetical protein
MTDITFHYPPELMSLLIDTIPLLNKTKKDVLTFFKGAGVPENDLADFRNCGYYRAQSQFTPVSVMGSATTKGRLMALWRIEHAIVSQIDLA